jgi:hypothetical protein
MKSFTLPLTAFAVATVALTAPASAAVPLGLPLPSPNTCLISDVSGATSCIGYYSGNIFSNSPADRATQTTALNALSFSGTPNFSAIYAVGSGLKLTGLSGASSLTFSGAPTLFGTTYLGVHWGNQSAIYKLFLSTPMTSITIIPNNPGGSSNAVLFSTTPYTPPPPPIPEPGTWAMMIVGFGLAGISLRRRSVTTSFA